MNRTEKQALAKWLAEIADTLEAAKDRCEASAKADLESHPDLKRLGFDHYPHMVGALGYVTKSSAESIRAGIRAYLEPKRRRA